MAISVPIPGAHIYHPDGNVDGCVLYRAICVFHSIVDDAVTLRGRQVYDEVPGLGIGAIVFQDDSNWAHFELGEGVCL